MIISSTHDPNYFHAAIYEFLENAEGVKVEGVSSHTKKSVWRWVAHRHAAYQLGISDEQYLATVEWLGSPECDLANDVYYPGYTPKWQRPGWAEQEKRNIAKAEAEGRLDEYLPETIARRRELTLQVGDLPAGVTGTLTRRNVMVERNRGKHREDPMPEILAFTVKNDPVWEALIAPLFKKMKKAGFSAMVIEAYDVVGSVALRFLG